MQKTTQTNLNNRLASKINTVEKREIVKIIFPAKIVKSWPDRSLTKTIEFLERVNLRESVVQVGTVAGFRGIRGDIRKGYNPVWELFSSRD